MADAPVTTLQVLQRGVETTPGTLVTATRRVPYEAGSLRPVQEQDSNVRRFGGSMATAHSSTRGLERAGLSYRQPGFYDELALDLTMFFGPAVITGAGADKTWTFVPPDASDTLKRWSYEMGGRDTWPEEDKFSGCVGERMTISWNKAEDLVAAIDLISVRNTQAAKAAGLTIPATLVPIEGRVGLVYRHATTFGSGAEARVLSGEFTIETGMSRRYGSDGNPYPNRIAMIGPRVVGASLVIEYDATAIRTAWRASTLQKLRVEFPGPSLGSTNYNARFDINGKWRTAELDEDDGVVTLAAELGAEYDATLGAEINAVVVCSLAALP